MPNKSKERRLKKEAEKAAKGVPTPAKKELEPIFQNGQVNLRAAIERLSKMPAFQNFAMQYKNNPQELERQVMNPETLKRFGLVPPSA